MSPISNNPEVWSFVSNNVSFFLSNRCESGSSSLLAFPFGTSLELHYISETPKMVKKFITAHGLSKASDRDCILVMVL